MSCSSFFAPEIIQNPVESPFFRASLTALYYPTLPEKGRPPDVQTVNLDEWSKYYRGAISSTDLEFLLYKMTAEDLGNLIASLEGKNVGLSNEGKAIKAAFEKYGRKDTVIRSLQYLVIAKGVEPIATSHANDG